MIAKTTHLLSSVACASLLLVAGTAHADVTISSAATSNMNCSAGVCTPTSSSAVLNAGDLETLLASGNVMVTTTGSGVQATNIVIDVAVSWSSTNAMTLDAYQSVAIDKRMTITGLGGLTLTTNDGGSGGGLFFGFNGSVQFANLSSPLTINGTSYALVGTVKGLAAAVAANPAGAYALAADFDAGRDGTYVSAPVATTLTGTFEGLGHAISNLVIASMNSSSLGLFAQNAGTLRDIRMVDASVTSPKSYTELGAMVGGNAGIVQGCSSSGSIGSSAQPQGAANGGLVGYNSGTILLSHSSAAVWGDTYAGGLVGSNGGSIVQSSASGTVSGGIDSISGGLAGDNQGVIAFSFARGTTSGYYFAGGLVGLNTAGGRIEQSFARGAVQAAQGVGGLVGDNDSGGAIAQSYSTSDVSASYYEIGGLVGMNGNTGTVTEAYSTGYVAPPSGSRGGLIGLDSSTPGSLANTYWDRTTSKVPVRRQGAGKPLNDQGITGLSSKQLGAGLPAGFDPTVWGENASINKGFPYLIANPPVK
ncbi:MAG TPA: hypothetical protein VGF97_14160 [Rhizomicrobium sp.]|jgi:hypothetical protein